MADPFDLVVLVPIQSLEQGKGLSGKGILHVNLFSNQGIDGGPIVGMDPCGQGYENRSKQKRFHVLGLCGTVLLSFLCFTPNLLQVALSALAPLESFLELFVCSRESPRFQRHPLVDRALHRRFAPRRTHRHQAVPDLPLP